jgi:predicted nucleotidyltransferase
VAEVESDPEDSFPDIAREGSPQFEPDEAAAFAVALRTLNATGICYVVAGAFAKHAYTGIWRDTKDLDLFLKADDLKTALDALAEAGYQTEIEFEHWLAKAHCDPYVIDLIFGMGHGKVRVTDRWFEYSQPVKIAGVPTRLIGLEELIVSKAYVAERYRFDGADILHLIRARQGQVDWQRVLAGLGPHRQLLLWHLVHFSFVYPGHANYLPQDLMVQLFEEMRADWSRSHPATAFRGTLLDPFSYLVDTEDWGYQDRRDLHPLVDETGELR